MDESAPTLFMVKVKNNYQKQKPDEIDLALDDVIEVKETEFETWWVGKSQKTGLQGWFPSNFVEKIDFTSPPSRPRPSKNFKKAIVLHDYEPKADEDLQLRKGSIVEILEEFDSWYLGRHGKDVGTFPSNFVQILSDKQLQQYQELVSKSTPKVHQAVPSPPQLPTRSMPDPYNVPRPQGPLPSHPMPIAKSNSRPLPTPPASTHSQPTSRPSLDSIIEPSSASESIPSTTPKKGMNRFKRVFSSKKDKSSNSSTPVPQSKRDSLVLPQNLADSESSNQPSKSPQIPQRTLPQPPKSPIQSSLPPPPAALPSPPSNNQPTSVSDVSSHPDTEYFESPSHPPQLPPLPSAPSLPIPPPPSRPSPSTDSLAQMALDSIGQKDRESRASLDSLPEPAGSVPEPTDSRLNISSKNVENNEKIKSDDNADVAGQDSETQDDSTTQKKVYGPPKLAKVLKDYSSDLPEELYLMADDIVEIIHMGTNNDNRWKGNYHGLIGYFPASAVEPIIESGDLIGTEPSENDEEKSEANESSTENQEPKQSDDLESSQDQTKPPGTSTALPSRKPPFNLPKGAGGMFLGADGLEAIRKIQLKSVSATSQESQPKSPEDNSLSGDRPEPISRSFSGLKPAKLPRPPTVTSDSQKTSGISDELAAKLALRFTASEPQQPHSIDDKKLDSHDSQIQASDKKSIPESESKAAELLDKARSKGYERKRMSTNPPKPIFNSETVQDSSKDKEKSKVIDEPSTTEKYKESDEHDKESQEEEERIKYLNSDELSKGISSISLSENSIKEDNQKQSSEPGEPKLTKEAEGSDKKRDLDLPSAESETESQNIRDSANEKHEDLEGDQQETVDNQEVPTNELLPVRTPEINHPKKAMKRLARKKPTAEAIAKNVDESQTRSLESSLKSSSVESKSPDVELNKSPSDSSNRKSSDRSAAGPPRPEKPKNLIGAVPSPFSNAFQYTGKAGSATASRIAALQKKLFSGSSDNSEPTSPVASNESTPHPKVPPTSSKPPPFMKKTVANSSSAEELKELRKNVDERFSEVESMLESISKLVRNEHGDFSSVGDIKSASSDEINKVVGKLQLEVESLKNKAFSGPSSSSDDYKITSEKLEDVIKKMSNLTQKYEMLNGRFMQYDKLIDSNSNISRQLEAKLEALSNEIKGIKSQIDQISKGNKDMVSRPEVEKIIQDKIKEIENRTTQKIEALNEENKKLKEKIQELREYVDDLVVEE
ncbi:hypothetical protein BB560_000176 [Smittium megazygosporum]|uniref:SH3 domain-containing protein n=1 Tax=Smittium megazygosporum TaxID=133381 RepID=A0A2T9ZL14_9FUNG|nr:hypothetical protein BB560_000176 [Smittium megazygosporum]